MRKLMFPLLLCCFMPFLGKADTIRFNEIMQSNVDNLFVEHDFPDSWVELYNSSNADINITGYKIGTSIDKETAYQITAATTIPADGYIVIYCDKLADKLHTNFRLESVDNGELYLFDASDNLVDHLSYPAMPAANIAYGVSCSDDTWGWELTPTPGTKNEGEITTSMLPAPIFSMAGKVMSSSGKVTITMPTGVPSDTRIYITTDGSEPNSSSTSYSKKTFDIKKTTVIRAKLISSQALSGPSTTHSYIFHHCKTEIPIVSIVTQDDYINSKTEGIFSSAKTNGKENYKYDWRRPVNVEYFNTQSGTTWFGQLGEIAVAGNASRGEVQKSVKIYSNKRFGEKRLKGIFWADKQKIDKVKSFTLRNGGNCCTFGRINDAFVQRIFGRNVSNLDYQSYEPAILYINGQYMGVYGLRERSNEDFVEANYGIDDIYLADHESYGNNATQRKESTFKEVYELYTKDATTYDQMANVIDVDNFMKTLIVEMFASNTDYPHNNIAMWKSKEPGSKWRWILKDLDRYNMGEEDYFNSFKFMFGTKSDSEYANVYNRYPSVQNAQKIYRKMMSFSKFKEAFIDAYATYLGDFLKPSVTTPVVMDMVEEIDEEMKKTETVYSKQKYGEEKGISYENFYLFATIGLGEDTPRRVRFVYDHMAEFFNLGSVIRMTVLPNNVNVLINGIGLSTDYFDGSYFSDRELKLTGGDHCTGWNLKTYKNGVLQKDVNLNNPNTKITLKSYAGCDSVSFTAIVEKTDFIKKMEELAISTTNCKNLSNLSTINIAEPQYAYANITGTKTLPTSKNDNIHAYIDLFDNAGNYLRKKVILNKQGNNTTEKTNLSILFCEDEWVGEETPIISFGDWIPQNEFHLKAFYEDGMRGTAEIAYQLYSQITNRDNCYPKAFPISLYIDGKFYGVMAWQLKKHRDNYGLDKKNDKQVWLDGTINDKQLFQKSIGWDKFEIRNPKDLYYVDGSEYDGDNPKEIMGSNSPAYDSSKAKMVRTANAKQHIIELSKYCSELKTLKDKGTSSKDIRAAIEQRFDVEELINYKIFSLITNNYDGFSKNWQWFTLDGKQWTVAPYDCNLTFGYNADGSELWSASQSSKEYDYEMQNCDSVGPMLWIKDYFWDDIKNRYKELRDNGTISAAAITALARNWYERIGEENYDEEWNRWPKSPCKSSFTDNPERFEEWIRYRIVLEDNYLDYASETKSYTLEMSSAEWATICVPFSFSVPDDIIAYTVKGVASDGCTLLLEPTTITEAYKPYLLCGPQGSYLISGESFTASSSDPDYLKNGLLCGTLTDTYAPKGSYVFQKNKVYGVGFYAVNSDNRFLVPANHAYLSTENASNLGHFRLPDYSNSIQTISEEDNTDAPTFNYWGQQIDVNACGFQIRRLPDGSFQKVIIK